MFAGQSLVTAVFALAYLFIKNPSYWLLIPAALHGILGAAWLLHQPLRQYPAGPG